MGIRGGASAIVIASALVTGCSSWGNLGTPNRAQSSAPVNDRQRLQRVWPSCCTAELVAVSNEGMTVGNDARSLRGNSTSRLESDLAAMAATQLAARRDVGYMSRTVGVGTGVTTLSADVEGLDTDIAALGTDLGSARARCGTVSDGCAAALTAIGADLTKAGDAVTKLNRYAGLP